MRVLICSAVLIVVAAVEVQAQACMGEAPLASSRYRLIGNAEFADDAKGYGAGIQVGGAAAFGSASVGIISYDDTDESTTAVGVAAGYEIPLGAARTLHMCPVGSFSYGFGPNDVLVEGVSVDMSTQSLQLGIGIGGILQSSPQLQVIPAGGLSFAYTNVTFDGGAQEIDVDDTFGIASFGVGFVFNQVLTIRPGVSMPFGLDENDPTFGLAVSVGFGRR